MPAIATTAIPPITYYWDATQADDIPQAQGIEGQQLLVRELEARIHWSDRTEMFMSEEVNSDIIDYSPVPPKRMFFVPTLYIDGGKGKPLPFELEDE